MGQKMGPLNSMNGKAEAADGYTHIEFASFIISTLSVVFLQFIVQRDRRYRPAKLKKGRML